ncbi:MAG: hypothetical protein DMF56_22400 [Acidobacteria bacterium]|nr:MAG: hypothetical protein DMF56_22400 [Acidobacteriota bacterium]
MAAQFSVRFGVALAVFTIAAADIFACAPAPHAGENVAIVEESAIIQWNPSTKTENFTRRATFRGTARDFGFLVPTPTAPQLEEVKDDVFDQLEQKTRRETVQKTTTEIDWTPLVLALLGRRRLGETATAGRAPVEVLETKKLAGYEASVLDATDASALNTWLTNYGYATTPDLAAWLDAYIKQGWKITAFKIDKAASEQARSAAIKMTFTTERPFFPYREPQSTLPYDSVRSLIIYFLGPERVAGKIGTNVFWPGVLMWSKNVDPQTRLTKFVDTSRIRPGNDDLYFSRDADQSAYVPPPYVEETVKKTWVPSDVIVLGLMLIAVGVRRFRR